MFDLYGNGIYADQCSSPNNFNPPYVNSTGNAVGYVGTDPTDQANDGGGGNVLIYDLPEDVISGNVGVVGTASDTGDVGTDIDNAVYAITFTNGSGILDGAQDADLMIVYTDADLPTFAGDGLDLVNVDANGNFTWLPDNFSYPSGNEYDFSSTELPEPASLWMLTIGIGGLGLGVFRRRKRVQQE